MGEITLVTFLKGKTRGLFLLLFGFVGLSLGFGQTCPSPYPGQDDLRDEYSPGCPANDVQIEELYIEVPGGSCNTCDEGSTVTANLFITLTNNSNAVRHGSVLGDLITTSPDGSQTTCTILTCNELAGGATETFDLGEITYTCGDALSLDNILVLWEVTSGVCPVDNPPSGKYCYPGDAILITPPLNAVATATCDDTDNLVDVSLEVNGGTAPYTYDWDTDGTGDFDDPMNLTNLNPETTYTVVVMDADGCTTTTSITTPACFICPTLTNESPDITTCEDDQGQTLSVQTDVGDIDIEFVWFTAQTTDPYTGGTQLGTAVTPTGMPLTATSSEGISGLAPGTYYAYAILDTDDPDLTDADCRPFAEIQITIEDKKDAGEDGSIALCEGDAAPTEAELFAALGGTPDAGGTWSGPDASGVYTYTHAATATCPEVSAMVTVTYEDKKDAGEDGSIALCEGDAAPTEAELFAALGGTPDAGGTWSGPDASGVYTYTHAATATCPEVSAMVTVTYEDKKDAGEDGSIALCEGDAAPTEAELFAALGGTPDAGGTWSGPDASGVYTYTHAATATCPEVSAMVTVTYEDKKDAGEDGSIALCEGDAAPTEAELFAALGGTPDAGGTWSGPDASGVYTYTHAATATCPEVSAMVTVTYEDKKDAGEDGSIALCEGDAAPTEAELFAALGGTPDAGGTWSGPDASGVYTYTHAATESCPEESAMVTVTYEDKKDAGEDGSIALCEGDAAPTEAELFAALGGTPDAGGTWSGPDASGVYTYTHAATATCPEVSAMVTVTYEDKKDAGEDGSIALCEGDAAPTEAELFAALGGTPDAGGTWSGPDASGVYTYTHAATESCPEESAMVTVTYEDKKDAGEDGSIALCEGDAAPTEAELFAALGGTPDAGGTWSGPDASGVYTYTHAATGSCPEESAMVTVTYEDKKDAGEDGSIALCEGDAAPTEAELFAALGGTPDAGGTWSGPDASGVYTYTHAATATCPEVSAMVTVTYQETRDAGEDGSIALCEGDAAPTEAELFAALGGTPDAGGTWSGPDASGVYTYTHAATGSCPEVSAMVTVTYEDKKDAGEDGNIALCEGDAAPTEAELFAALGGTPDAGGTWSGPDASGVYTYTHAATANCPEESAMVTVTYEDKKDAGEDGSIALCEGDAAPTDAELFAALGGTPDAGGTWSGPDASGVYTYTHAATGSCPEVSAMVTVTYDEAPDAGPDNTTSVCEGTIVDLSELVTVSGGTFMTTNGGTITNGDEFDTTGLAEGTYTIEYTVESGNTCPDDTAIIKIHVSEDIIERQCETMNIDYCDPDNAPFYSFWWEESQNSPAGSRFYAQDATHKLTFTEFTNGTALIEGSVILGTCSVEVYVVMEGKMYWDEWVDAGGGFKAMGCDLNAVDKTQLYYYMINGDQSFAKVTGGDCLEEGTFKLTPRPDPNDPTMPKLGVYVGPGGALWDSDSTVDGLAGWAFMGPEGDEKRYHIDFNFHFDCEDTIGCESDTEICDGIDNDGDGEIDEGFDSDQDGTPDCEDVEECDGVDNDGDGEIDEGLNCNDVEICDGVDNDGDGEIDEGFDDTDGDGIADCVDDCDNRLDADGDGVADCVDVEECDGVDNDGDGMIDEGFDDTDGDGVADCVDVEECDGVDNDGDGEIDEGFDDTDGDGVADCEDVEECDGVDNDGDGMIDEGFDDTDGDGVADCVDVEECDGVDNDGDGMIDEGFDDTDGDGVADCVDVEECDGVDNDGDGEIDEGFDDTDGDGVADCVDVEECDGVDNDGDGEIDEGFDDTDGDGVADCVDVEECDGVDNDGDGEIDEGFDDTDGDGVADCVDVEECDGVDNDGDGEIDEGFDDTDGDGVADCVDVEECDGVDNDGDGEIDEGFDDTDGDGVADCVDVEECDGVDNDGDGEIDEGFDDTDGDGVADCVDVEECDGVDNDGDGEIDEGFDDTDGDGVADCVDVEECDGVDNDGDGMIDEGFDDTDGDGVADCVDVEECDGVDNDGDGEIDEGFDDTDGDGVADCVDVEECDGVDNDGDGEIDEGFDDTDGDGIADCVDLNITVKKLTNESCPGKEDGQITLDIDGGKPNYTFVWSNGETTKNINQLAAGDYTVTVTDSNGLMAELIVTVGLDNDSCGKGKGAGGKSVVKAYPMAFKDILNVEIELTYDSETLIQFSDMNGRTIKIDKNVKLTKGVNKLRYNLDYFSSDMYFILIKTDREEIVKKIISAK